MQSNFNVVRSYDQHLLHAANAFKASLSPTCTALHPAATALFVTPIIHMHSTLNSSTAEHFHLDASLLYVKDEFNPKLPY